MNIVVTVKQVPDPNMPPSYLALDAEGRRVVSPFGVAPVMNGYDANALEAALRLKEQHGGRVTVVSLGDDDGRKVLKSAVAMGADAGVLVSNADWPDADSGMTGRVLAAAIRKMGAVDLVLCGRQASDTDGGQVLHWIAEALGLPAVSPVSRIEGLHDGALIVDRLGDEAQQRVRVALPALLGISSETNEPRLATLRGTMMAGRVMIPTWKAADFALSNVERKVTVRSVRFPEGRAKAEMIAGASPAEQGAALADKLHELGLI